jgi:hypothetical protein
LSCNKNAGVKTATRESTCAHNNTRTTTPPRLEVQEDHFISGSVDSGVCLHSSFADMPCHIAKVQSTRRSRAGPAWLR